MENKQLDEKFTNTELGDLKREMETEKTKNAIEIDQLKKALSELIDNAKIVVNIKN